MVSNSGLLILFTKSSIESDSHQGPFKFPIPYRLLRYAIVASQDSSLVL
nr:MAG TPA: hypothetical protein [Caudoviricetes sp.]